MNTNAALTRAYLGLGANLGDARQTLRDAVVCLAQQQAVTVQAKSSWYLSAPVDADGDDYYNCVVAIDTTLSAIELLELCLSIEKRFGRTRSYRNAPRVLDIDILLFGDKQIASTRLNVPHPRLTQRAFALAPLLELDAEIVIPGYGRAIDYLSQVSTQRIQKAEPCSHCLLEFLPKIP
jgi:2-amino-4-hydroxy-6-hydroxymethyldihydropteridine diphosphokinase